MPPPPRPPKPGGGPTGFGGLGGGGMGGLFGGAGGGMGEDDPFAAMMGGMMGGGMMGGMPMGGGMGGMPMGGGMGGGMPTGGGAPARVDVLAPGTAVRLHGLTAGAHNDALGTVAAFDAAKGRYAVQLADGATLSIKPENVAQVVSACRVVGTSREELNGRVAAAATYHSGTKRYRCEGLRPDGGVVSLKAENVVLPTSTRVVIDGVTSRPALNGCVGAVRAVDEAAGRYDVALEGGEAVRLRFGAVAAC